MGVLKSVILATYIAIIVSMVIAFSKKDNHALVRIQEFPDFLSAEECDMIISLSGDTLVESTVYTDTSDVVSDGHRKSKQTWLYNKQHELIQNISERVAKLTNTPLANQEPLQVVKYEAGGFFNAHFDACNGDPKFCERLNKGSGPRRITLLIYLNDDFEGGETFFPNLNYTAQPKKGKAVMFYGTDDNDKLLEGSLHGGNPVKSGVKWVCNKWIRPLKYNSN
jgi:prolyl 4-hydroxylase